VVDFRCGIGSVTPFRNSKNSLGIALPFDWEQVRVRRIRQPCHRSENCRDVVPGLGRQQAERAENSEIRTSAAFDCGLQIMFACVVRRQRQRPGAEFRVEVAKVVSCGARGLFHIDAVVFRVINNQAISARSCWHELPDAACAFGRKCHRIGAAFDKNDGR
jgi:hypothetical protein